MITVWGRTTSSNVQTVMWALAELGLEHERIDVGGPFGGLDTPEFSAMNPNRLIPVLRDGDEYLWESASIVRYLAARYGSERFWPTDPLKRAKLDQWSDWTKTTLVPAFLTHVFQPMMRNKPGERDEAALAKGIANLGKVMRVLDGRLPAGAYLGGNEPCFADVVVGVLLYRYFTLEIERPALPHLEAYYGRLTERPAYARHVMISYDFMRAK
ncbi:glutathione S-transferase family protein [Manganibacter manganicus]|uniref:Glutathione S-transferase n=1 Tax=Manganibacter manganicus TaxID=1873176 RepID=A0A1V8RPX8_9HYPH|nr:glutathione S-transferase family protein [Pseudaminobacter manganicus]OQM75183.1 glutathione S-transferase [Pseudaminobacter manganicus]